MKLFFYSCFLVVLAWSCTQEKSEKEDIHVETVNTNQIETGIKETYYPNGKLQMRGKLNNDGQKNGVWISYFENGQKNSESNFKDGINNGYSMVWFPNGNVRYFGDYLNGKRSGTWTYYNEKGKVVKSESY